MTSSVNLLNTGLRRRYKCGMSNVIRPTFGARPKLEVVAPAGEGLALRLFGEAAGYAVALIEDADAEAGNVLKVVVGPLGGSEVEAVAILPSTPEGGADADVVGMAIMRTLEVIEAAGRGPETA